MGPKPSTNSAQIIPYLVAQIDHLWCAVNTLINNGGGGGDTTLVGGVITSLPAIGDNVPAGPASAWILAEFYKTQGPTASLAGGRNLEKTVPSTAIGENLNWTAGRQSGTVLLSTIVVAGNNETFVQPAAPGTVSGTQDVSVVSNNNTTFTMIVTTVDGKTATASTTFTFLNGRYWGFVPNSSPTDANIMAGNKELSSSRAKSGFTISVVGTNQFLVYAYPASEGNLTSFTVGGFESLPTFTLTTRNFTNINGFTESYNIYVSQNTYSNVVTPSLSTL